MQTLQRQSLELALKWRPLGGKVALITGASGGIGRAISRKLAEEGASLILHCFRKIMEMEAFLTELQELYPEQRFVCFSLDLTQSGAGLHLIEEAESLLASPDILIHNAGIAKLGMMNDLTLDDYQALQRIHLENPLFACQRAFPHMLSQKWGRVVTISSIWGLNGSSCEVAYSAVKAGMIGMTKALAKEWGPSGVTVNCVAPGVIDTEMNRDLDEETKASLIEETPVGRMGMPEDIAEAVAYFVSPMASFTTGQVISPNGGLFT